MKDPNDHLLRKIDGGPQGQRGKACRMVAPERFPRYQVSYDNQATLADS